MRNEAEKLFNDNIKLVYWAYGRIRNMQALSHVEKDDLIQELFIAFMDACETYDASKSKLGTYWWWVSRRIATSICRKEILQRKRMHRVAKERPSITPVLMEGDYSLDPADYRSTNDERDISEAVNALKDATISEKRHMFLDLKLEGKTKDEIMSIMEMSERTYKWRMEQLRNDIKKQQAASGLRV